MLVLIAADGTVTNPDGTPVGTVTAAATVGDVDPNNGTALRLVRYTVQDESGGMWVGTAARVHRNIPVALRRLPAAGTYVVPPVGNGSSGTPAQRLGRALSAASGITPMEPTFGADTDGVRLPVASGARAEDVLPNRGHWPRWR